MRKFDPEFNCELTYDSAALALAELGSIAIALSRRTARALPCPKRDISQRADVSAESRALLTIRRIPKSLTSVNKREKQTIRRWSAFISYKGLEKDAFRELLLGFELKRGYIFDRFK